MVPLVKLAIIFEMEGKATLTKIVLSFYTFISNRKTAKSYV